MDLQQQDQASHQGDPIAAPLHVASVALAVRDLGRVVAFYRDVIGLAVIQQSDDTAYLGAGGVTLLQLLHRPDAAPDDPAAAGLFHTAFLLPTRADLGRWLGHARASGLRLDGAADHLVSEAVYLSDPEGNGIEIYADRPASVWRWASTARLPEIEMANRPLDIPGLIAAAPAPWVGAPAGTRVGHVHLRVGDIAQAAGFYVGTVGLAMTRMLPEAAFMSTGGYHHHLAANVWRSPGAGARDPNRAGLAWLTMQASDASVASGIAQRSHIEDLAGAGLHDPWGTQVKIITAHR